MENKEMSLIISIIVISLLCITSLFIKYKAKKPGEPFRKQLKESFTCFLDFNKSEDIEPKVLEYLILPFIFTYFFVRFSNIGDGSLNVINNVYNTTIYTIFKVETLKLFFTILILCILALFAMLLSKKSRNKSDKLWLTIIADFVLFIVLSFVSIIFLSILIVEFGNFGDTDVFIPLYYTVVIAVIKLENKYLPIKEFFIKFILSILIILSLFIFAGFNRNEYSGGYYFYATRDNQYFNLMSKNIDIDLKSNSSDEFYFVFNEKYKLDHQFTILAEENEPLKSKDIKMNKEYYLGELDSKSRKFHKTDTKVKFNKDELTLQKRDNSKLHFVRDGSMRMVEVSDKCFSSDISGAKYYNH